MIKSKLIIFIAIPATMILGLAVGTTQSYLSDPETSTNNVVRVINEWYDFAWHWRKPITINNGGGALTNYQVKVVINTQELISAGKMQSNGNDIRFTTSGGVTSIDYWIESGINTASTVIWVEVPSIPAGNSIIYIYYGNASAAAASNASNTFLFFDDFSGTLSKWTTIAGTWAINAGRLTTTAGTGRSAIYGTGTSFGDAIIEFKSTAPSTTADHNIGSYQRGDGTLGNTNTWLRFYWDTMAEDWKLKDGATVYANAPGDSLEGVWRNLKIVMVGATQQLYVDGIMKIDYTGASGTNPGRVGVLSYAASYLAGKYWDDYRVRKYASPEPTISDIGAEE